ncbi:MAG: replicative DNA helicase [Oscillospiraceae bacterium]|nr:replicative DNA helicase [Oscillospiraceae bacterium]
MAFDERGFELSFETLGINLPYSVEAEQAVLGAILVEAAVFDEVGTGLLPEHFYTEQNAGIFREMMLLSAAARPIDFVTVLNSVVSAGVFPSEEDAKLYLYTLTQTVPTISNVSAYAKIVFDKYQLRAIMSLCRDVMSEASSGSVSSEMLLELLEQRSYEVRGGRNRSELWVLSDVLKGVIERLEQISGPDREKYLGLTTGFDSLDRLLTGLNKSDLIVLAARPGVGKTSLALNIVANLAARRKDVAAAYFSLEMTKQQIAQRILSSSSGIASGVFRSGVKNQESWVYIIDSMGRIARDRIYIDDTSGISVGEIKAKARRVKDLGLIVVDYLQLMGGNARRSDSRVNEISEITRAFKIMAKELDVPVLLLSQLSRDSEKQGRRPKLSDLRDSGSIEQDADIVMFLHREDEPSEGAQSEQSSAVSLIVAKNRHGEVARIKLHWDGARTLFTALDFNEEDS